MGLLRPVVGQSVSEPVADDDELGAGNLNLEASKHFRLDVTRNMIAGSRVVSADNFVHLHLQFSSLGLPSSTSKSPLDRLLHSVRNVAPSELDVGVGGRQCGDSLDRSRDSVTASVTLHLPPASTSTRRSGWLRSCTPFRSLPSTWHRCQSRCMPLYAATSFRH